MPNEMAKELGVTALQLRNWLRSQKAAGHPLLAGHRYRERWEFSGAEADQLISEFATERRGRRRAATRGGATESAVSRRSPGGGSDPPKPQRLPRSRSPGHRVTEGWMGEKVETLADLLRDGLRAVVVGINPAPRSVAAGHYYQGTSGQRFFARLASVSLLPSGEGFEDDRAFAAGIGFTDVVKRPTASAKDLRRGELEHGRVLLEAKLADFDVPLIIFTFKGAATPLLGPFDGHGSLGRKRLTGARIFVMPGPMEKRERVEAALIQLRRFVA